MFGKTVVSIGVFVRSSSMIVCNSSFCRQTPVAMAGKNRLDFFGIVPGICFISTRTGASRPALPYSTPLPLQTGCFVQHRAVAKIIKITSWGCFCSYGSTHGQCRYQCRYSQYLNHLPHLSSHKKPNQTNKNTLPR